MSQSMIGTYESGIQHAVFQYMVVDKVVRVVDIGLTHRSVTNDADHVIKVLRERGVDLTLPVIYRDSMGRWDQLLVEGGEFKDFKILQKTTEFDAAQAVLKQREQDAIDNFLNKQEPI